MNENIDLTKILKDCPTGTEFWSDNYGKVQFLRIGRSLDYPIRVRRTNGFPTYYTKEGWYNIDFPANCLLWPSKDCRDWSKFTAPWYKKEKFDPKTLKPFDRVLVRDSCAYSWRCTLYSHTKENENTFKYVAGDISYEYCIPYNDDTQHLVGTKDEAPEFYRYWEDSYEYEKKE